MEPFRNDFIKDHRAQRYRPETTDVVVIGGDFKAKARKQKISKTAARIRTRRPSPAIIFTQVLSTGFFFSVQAPGDRPSACSVGFLCLLACNLHERPNCWHCGPRDTWRRGHLNAPLSGSLTAPKVDAALVFLLLPACAVTEFLMASSIRRLERYRTSGSSIKWMDGISERRSRAARNKKKRKKKQPLGYPSTMFHRNRAQGEQVTLMGRQVGQVRMSFIFFNFLFLNFQPGFHERRHRDTISAIGVGSYFDTVVGLPWSPP